MTGDNVVRVCHFTSAHQTSDDRIFLKECQALAQSGHEVYIVGKGENKEAAGIHIVGCGTVKGRMDRFFLFSKRVFRTAVRLNCDVYHFHDPDLLLYGLKLKRKGKKVIFDSHEDVPAQIMDKTWIPKSLRGMISKLYRTLETYVCKRIDAVIAATPHIAEQFHHRAKRVVTVNNYPKLDDIQFHEKDFALREKAACYVGGISSIRGEQVMLQSMKENSEGKIYLAGAHMRGRDSLERHMQGIEYLGTLSRTKVNELYGKCRVGVVLYQPAKNHFEAQPIKMFEYMAAGLPVVASDFPHWRTIVEENRCGICVPPNNAAAAREAILKLILEPKVAQEIGKRGYQAVIEKYNWKNEEKKLCELYNCI